MKKKTKLIMLKGLPGSGKTLWIKEHMEKTSKICKGYTRRINKDDLRNMIDSSVWTKHNEETIIKARNALIDILSLNPDTKEIVIDDTNFAPKHEEVLRKMAEERGWEFEIKEFKISLGEAIKRDKNRESPVGAKVIKRMWLQYIEPALIMKDKYPWLCRNSELKDCIICDIDGTLALHNTRGPFEIEKCDTDIVNRPVRELLSYFFYFNDIAKSEIFLFSGREERYREVTERWLKNNNIEYFALYMRSTGDNRADDIIKEELYNEYVKDKCNVLFCVDDRPRVVKKWKELGLFVLDVYQDIDRVEF